MSAIFKFLGYTFLLIAVLFLFNVLFIHYDTPNYYNSMSGWILVFLIVAGVFMGTSNVIKLRLFNSRFPYLMGGIGGFYVIGFMRYKKMIPSEVWTSTDLFFLGFCFVCILIYGRPTIDSKIMMQRVAKGLTPEVLSSPQTFQEYKQKALKEYDESGLVGDWFFSKFRKTKYRLWMEERSRADAMMTEMYRSFHQPRNFEMADKQFEIDMQKIALETLRLDTEKAKLFADKKLAEYKVFKIDQKMNQAKDAK